MVCSIVSLSLCNRAIPSLVSLSVPKVVNASNENSFRLLDACAVGQIKTPPSQEDSVRVPRVHHVWKNNFCSGFGYRC